MVKQCSRTALADGWGGSMVASDISDILFGTPSPVLAGVDMGCLDEKQVNIIVNGHEPNLFESIIASVNDPKLLKEAEKAGAEGINILGMCCSGAEVLSRHGVPHAGNFMSTEAVLITGAVDCMSVDVQCIMPALAPLAECYGTKFFTTPQQVARLGHGGRAGTAAIGGRVPDLFRVRFDRHDSARRAGAQRRRHIPCARRWSCTGSRGARPRPCERAC